MGVFRVLRKVVIGLLALVGAFVIVAAVAALWVGSLGSSKPSVPDRNVVLTLELGQPIKERAHGGLAAAALGRGITLRDLVAGLEAAALDEYLAIVGRTDFDKSRFAVTHDIRETDPSLFIDLENKSL